MPAHDIPAWHGVLVATAIPFLVWLGPGALAGSVSAFAVLAAILAAVAAGLANRQS